MNTSCGSSGLRLDHSSGNPTKLGVGSNGFKLFSDASSQDGHKMGVIQAEEYIHGPATSSQRQIGQVGPTGFQLLPVDNRHRLRDDGQRSSADRDDLSDLVDYL